MTNALETKALGTDVSAAFEEFSRAFEAFKETNDQRLEALEARRPVDILVEEKLARIDAALDETNLADYCTALEGVSHFHYLMWNLTRNRRVSLLELELQAEVDKYASALTLMTRQRGGYFPAMLHARLFHHVAFLPCLDAAARRRYEEANRHAARYCRELEERYLRSRRQRPEAWVAELRRFFRRGHQEKIRQLVV